MARSLGRYFFAVSLALFSFGCGRSPAPGEAAVATQTLKFQAFGDPEELDSYRELIAAFERAAPDVKVEIIPVGSQRDHMTKLTVGFAGGVPADLFLINFRRFGQFAEKNVLEHLGPRMAERGHLKESDLYEQATDAFRYNGTLQCIPQNVSSLVVYYNRKLFQEAGVAFPNANWTWQHFLAAAKQLTKDNDGDGKTDIYGVGFEPTLIRLAPFIWQAGGEIVDDLQRPNRFMLDESGALEALAFVHSLSHEHHVVPGLAREISESHDARFARGGLGMILQSRRYTATLRAVPNLDWDVAPLPTHKRTATVLHADAYCVARSSEVKDAAYRFIEFALSPEGSTTIAKTGRTVPSLKSVAESPAFLDPTAPPKSARVFLDSLSNMRRPPNIANWNEIESRVDPVLEAWYTHEGPEPYPVSKSVNTAAGHLLNPPKR